MNGKRVDFKEYDLGKDFEVNSSMTGILCHQKVTH